jgi:hypothetical protein
MVDCKRGCEWCYCNSVLVSDVDLKELLGIHMGVTIDAAVVLFAPESRSTSTRLVKPVDRHKTAGTATRVH